GAVAGGLSFWGGLLHFRAAMRAKLGALKYQAEARRAGNGGKPRAAMVALRGVGGLRRAAHRAVECFGFHDWIAYESCERIAKSSGVAKEQRAGERMTGE